MADLAKLTLADLNIIELFKAASSIGEVVLKPETVTIGGYHIRVGPNCIVCLQKGHTTAEDIANARQYLYDQIPKEASTKVPFNAILISPTPLEGIAIGELFSILRSTMSEFQVVFNAINKTGGWFILVADNQLVALPAAFVQKFVRFKLFPSIASTVEFLKTNPLTYN